MQFWKMREIERFPKAKEVFADNKLVGIFAINDNPLFIKKRTRILVSRDRKSRITLAWHSLVSSELAFQFPRAIGKLLIPSSLRTSRSNVP